MSEIINMLASIEEIINATLSVDQSRISSSSNNDIYEAYIFFLVLEAARIENANISYYTNSGAVASILTFRTSPGVIYSTAHPYTHALIDFGNNIPSLEAHIGIKLVGKSQVLHEADVVVLNAEESGNCRNNSYSPSSSKSILSVECKYYSTNLQLNLARSFIGLVQDLSVKEPFFVSNTSSNSVEKLLSKRVNNWEKNIIPSSTSAEVQRLIGSFRNVFKNYKAQYS